MTSEQPERRPIRTVGLIASLNRKRAQEAAGPLVAALRQAGVQVFAPQAVAEAAGLDCRTVASDEAIRADLLIVLGGDGTLLHTAGWAAPLGMPVLGVDLGSFGFLAESPLDELHNRLDTILAGEFEVEERIMLRVSVQREGGEMGPWHGLNDAVVGVRTYSYLVRLGVSLDGEEVATYPADGLIVATATGSTAYSLSAGGPIIDPKVPSFVITPICPHTLQTRPIVIDPGAVVSVKIKHEREVVGGLLLTVDGGLVAELKPQDLVIVRRAGFDARLVRVGAGTFYTRLRGKLNWGLAH